VRRARSLLAALLFAASCGPGEPPAPPPPAAPPAAPPPPPVEELAELELPSWEEADPDVFPKRPDAPPGPLAWNFAAGRRFGYEFSQIVHQATTARQGTQTASVSGRDRNRGTFEFAGRGGSAGVLVSIETKEVVRDGREVPAADLKKNPPSRFEGTLKEDGSSQVKRVAGSSDGQVFFDVLLAIAEGDRALEDGRISTRRAGTYKIGARDCVRLESEFRTASSVPGLRRAMRGRVVSYFDPVERRFIRASAAVRGALRQSAAVEGLEPVIRDIESRTEFRVQLLE
jgi:hypothetical protein